MVTDDAGNSRKTAGVSGTGTMLPSLSPAEVGIRGRTVTGVQTCALPITLSNPTSTALSITSIAFTGTNPGDFGQTNNCGSSVAAGGNCTINVTFKIGRASCRERA